MPKTESVTVDLSVELLAQVREAVKRGLYRSEDEAIAEALVDWSLKGHTEDENIEWLRQALQQADDCLEPDVPSEEMEAVFDRLEAKYRARIAESSVQG